MKGNEAIERFRCCQENTGDCGKCKFYTCCGIYDMENIAINALEEVQKYRKIGTLEELKEVSKYLRLVKKHGTVGKAIEACAEYEEIGSVEECREAIKKQKPERPRCTCNSTGILVRKKYYACSRCGNQVLEKRMNERQNTNYCWDCGQKLDWSDCDE